MIIVLDILQILSWLCYLSLGLLSITIPTYAISAAFLGRESRRSLWNRERKQKDLKKKLRSMSKQSGVGIEALRNEVSACEEDIKKVNVGLERLSVKGAFIYPFASFLAAFAFGVFGVTVEQLPATGVYVESVAGLVSALLVLYGGYQLYASLRAINEAALSPQTHASLRVSFSSGSTAETFRHSKRPLVSIDIHNYGWEMAKDVMVQLYFPREFVVGPYSLELVTPYRMTAGVIAQTGQTDYPGRTACSITIEKLHGDCLVEAYLRTIKMPSRPDRYDVPVRVWEERLGRIESILTFDVT